MKVYAHVGASIFMQNHTSHSAVIAYSVNMVKFIYSRDTETSKGRLAKAISNIKTRRKYAALDIP